MQECAQDSSLRRRIIHFSLSLVVVAFACSISVNDGHVEGQFQIQDYATSLTWHDSGLQWPSHEGILCMDSLHPHVFYVDDRELGTMAYDWASGQKNVISVRQFAVCGPRGLLYSPTEQGAWLYSLDDPAGKPIDHMPTAVASDGSLQVYSLAPALEGTNPIFWASPDGGLTWERPPIPSGWLFNKLVVSESDARALYAEVSELDKQGEAQDSYYVFSSDAGQTWEKRRPAYTLDPDQDEVRDQLDAMPGSVAPFDMLLRSVTHSGGSVKGYGAYVYLSSDGARNFHEVGANAYGNILHLVYTPQGIVRLSRTLSDLVYRLDRSSDGGNTWLPLREARDLAASRGVPGSIFLRGGAYSPDSGDHWLSFPDNTDEKIWIHYNGSPQHTPYRLDVTPYLPLTVLGLKDQQLVTIDLPVDGSGLLAPALPNRSPGTRYFSEISHNVRSSFKRYWEAHGGLAQQGYPLTEPFQRVSDTDGRVYKTQYFERSVFELHPENKPPYDVLLSLLGVEAYKQRYGAIGSPGQLPSNDNPRYYPETGHTIGGKFRAYWEDHGGLIQQGYPISDEFSELSALDGKNYTVQYFQRAVFELHPENVGTPYEILLSQLGSFKAKQLMPGT